ncbi:MAG: hypothetical protein HOV96_19550 [Nonomuraea sp.]|nr:hypothetical protein [Nonomuraea sp.]
MNWPEFVVMAELAMREAGVDPDDVTMRVEVGDSYYNADTTPDGIGVSRYNDRPYLVIWGQP